MEDSRVPHQAIQSELTGYKRKNWMDNVGRDLKDMDTTWDEAEEPATDRAEWHQRVAQCIQLDEG